MSAARSPWIARVAPRTARWSGSGGLVAALALGAASGARAQGAPATTPGQDPAARPVGSELTAAAANASLGGVVYDSLAGRPLAGAVVQVVRAADLRAGVTSVTADSLGRYTVGGLAPGRYLVGFAHPDLDALAVQVVPRAVDIVDPGAAGMLPLATPGPARMRAALCPALAAGDSSGAVAGAVRDAGTDAPAGDATVVLTWSELAVTRGGLRKEPREVAAAVRPDGTFLVCGVPADGAVQAVASAPGRASGAVEIAAPARGLTIQRLALGPVDAGVARDRAAAEGAASPSPGTTAAPAAPAAPATPAGGAGRGTPARTGTARLAGRVVGPTGAPVRGARLRVWGAGPESETRADGEFALAALPAGTHTLEVRAVGRPPTRVAVDLVAGRTTEVRVALPRPVPELERVVAVGEASRRSAIMEGFLARQRTGMGRYYTRADIERIVALDVTDVVRMSASPALRVETVPRTPNGPVRSVLRGRNGCAPRLYLDGVLVSNGADEIDDVVRPSSVMAMEVYAGPATVPPAYALPGAGEALRNASTISCGVVLIWTRH